MRWNWLPNAICVLRLLLVAPIIAMLLDERYLAALALILLAGFSDALDGFLARTFDWRTRLGSLLDPAADKLLIFSVFVTLSYQGLVPVFVTVVVVMRDVVIIAGAALYQWLIAPLAGDPTIISKLNTACQLMFALCTLTSAALQWPPQVVLTLLGAAVLFTSLTSGLHYVVSWSKRALRDSRGAA
jgi:cardiolipin synthase